MKRKTFVRLRLFALSLLLLEAMLLFVLLLAHNSASAEDSGNFGGSGAGITHKTRHGGDFADSQGAGNGGGITNGNGNSGHSPYLCDGRDCPVAADGFGGPGGAGQDFAGQDFSSHGGVNGGGGSSAAGKGGAGQNFPDGGQPAFGFFAGGGGGSKSGGGSNNSGTNNDGGDGDTGSKGSGGQQDDGAGGQDGGDGGSADPVLVSDFISPDTGNVGGGDPPPGAGDPLIVDITDPITPVPEPMSGPLLAAGLAAIVVLRRRRRCA